MRDDELERTAAFDDLLRIGRMDEASKLAEHLGSGGRAHVLQLLHEVFRAKPQTVPESSTIEPSKPPPFERIGRFEIRNLIGRGAFGSVYLAHDPVLQRLVAIKVIHPHLMSDLSARRRVLREREVVAKLQHPNIVPVWEAGRATGPVVLGKRLLSWSHTGSVACPTVATIRFKGKKCLVPAGRYAPGRRLDGATCGCGASLS